MMGRLSGLMRAKGGDVCERILKARKDTRDKILY